MRNVWFVLVLFLFLFVTTDDDDDHYYDCDYQDAMKKYNGANRICPGREKERERVRKM